MIIISASLPKSASSILLAYTEDILKYSKKRNGQDVLKKVIKENKIKGSGIFIDRWDCQTVLKLLAIHFRYGSILVKTHSKPTKIIKALIKFKIARATYIYRDPRDIILSGIDHGRRYIKEKRHSVFNSWTDINSALPWVKIILKNCRQWLHYGMALFLRYEDLVKNPLQELKRVNHYLGLKVDEEELQNIINEHEKNKRYGVRKFNKGATDRYLHEMTEEEIITCNTELGHIIKFLGYTA